MDIPTQPLIRCSVGQTVSRTWAMPSSTARGSPRTMVVLACMPVLLPGGAPAASPRPPIVLVPPVPETTPLSRSAAVWRVGTRRRPPSTLRRRPAPGRRCVTGTHRRSGGGHQPGEDDDVQLVVAGVLVEPATAGDQPQPGVVEVAVDR